MEKNRWSWFKSTSKYQELDGIDRQPVEFGWRILSGCTTKRTHIFDQFDNEKCIRKEFRPGTLLFLGPGSETKWNATDTVNPEGEMGQSHHSWWKNFSPSDHPIFNATSALDRRQLNIRGSERKSIHFCANAETIETIFRTDVSANQLRIYGAVADLCVKNFKDELILTVLIFVRSNQSRWW